MELGDFLFIVEIFAATMFWLRPEDRWPVIPMFILIEFLFRKTEGEFEIPPALKFRRPINIFKVWSYLIAERLKSILGDFFWVFLTGLIFAISYDAFLIMQK